MTARQHRRLILAIETAATVGILVGFIWFRRYTGW